MAGQADGAGGPRIVVVGGGAGGLELATRLGDRLGKRGTAQIVLVDRNPTHIWKPLLHEVAAGSMDPNTHQLEYAAQARWHGFEFQQGELKALDRAGKTITVSGYLDADGTEVLPERAIPYDVLVLSIGSVTHFFGVPGTAEHAIALDTASQAERFRRKLISACMRAQNGVPGARSQVDIAIVGAGATGVELSAELRNTAHVLAAYGLHKLDPRRDICIHLIEGGPRILPALSERVSAETTKLLHKLNVDVITGERVTEVTGTAVNTASGKSIPADLTVWAAGIRAPSVLGELGLPVNKLGQVIVSRTLQVDGEETIYAFGDCASCPWPETSGSVPPRAQAAHQQATYLFKALRLRLEGKPAEPFAFKDLGSLVSLGHFSAVGSLMGGLIGGSMFIEGLMARLMYTSLYRMHVMALHGFIRMALDTVTHWLRSKTNPRVKLH
ncbi:MULTISPECIES: NAD(P)/FAD-dependent oxidoreductase [Ralstonia]|uniref:NADH dehydrogenase n=1 Tax=Ralstonia mannitolilytica TaxID=105219 RepID=A0AAJ4ZK83_9RALS|nr:MULTISPECIES: NAD(P)/FAD-dependent oxidoreductase [Ralstonia]AJW45816.1 pyridine nucleotide-disulfide oxidoreductase [Ralstonia mannitolilytica]MBU9578090.1 NAD(P)/FAD-dependent oxidoreductase [Ralstonia mannitolilytica]PLT19711.1 NAD(P)/FAD-dependent oxidoreductase [Ralstonia mannitolilytica]QIF07996.1 NAD(P)/FAD-dependent oxidoreductase [Ralstonia mannitolilytica]CAG2141023.1 NADH dehydrogenase [Ralstonia mannitolilytica]